MGYDSKEEKERAEKLAKKMDAYLELLRDKEFMMHFKTTAENLSNMVETLQEKARYEPLEPHERELLAFVAEQLPHLKQIAEDGRLILEHVLYQAAVTHYFDLKKKAEQGNEEARAKYEELRPLYEKSNLPEDNKKGELN